MGLQRKVTVAAGLTALALGLAPQLADACAVCGLDLDGAAGHAYKVSELFMMAVPYITFLVIGSAMYVSWRKAHPRPDMATVGIYKTVRSLASRIMTSSNEGRGETL